MTSHILTTDTIIDGGGFSHIFALPDDTVVKLFRRHEVVQGQLEDPADNDVVLRAVWDSECAAYELLADHPALARYVAGYFGRTTIASVSAPDGSDVSSGYLLDCAYRLVRIPGTATKFALLSDTPVYSDLIRFLDAIDEVGVRNALDGSAFVPGLGVPFTVIDISTWDAMADLSQALIQNGRLSDSSRSRWAPRAVT